MLRSLTPTFTILWAGGMTTAAQENVPSKATTNPQSPAVAAPATGGRPAGAPVPPSDEPQPYEKVITKEAKSKSGAFTVHQVKDKYYYEIPRTELNKDFLWVSRIAKTVMGVGVAGQELATGVVRWERAGNRINL